MSTIENVAVSSMFTYWMILFSFGAIILMSFTKIEITGPSRSGFVTKILCSTLISARPSFWRKKSESL